MNNKERISNIENVNEQETMEFRNASFDDLPTIMEIIRQAKIYMNENNLDQWKDGYPDEQIIGNDIKKYCSYVLVHNGTLVGTAAVFFDEEKTYRQIFGGSWLTHGDYAVVHRVAVSSAFRNTGAATVMMKHIEQLSLGKGVHSVKIDTHEDNLPMRKFLAKCGFQYCGIIYLENGDKRLAYEKT
jgi:RimJ/RimL family protein N-acetyltransferase